MKKSQNNLKDAEILRQKAEAQLKKQQSKVSPLSTENDLRKLAHELQVHQIELEMQYEQLNQAKEAADAATQKYTELYDFAPSGYFTLTKLGEIIELNLLGASLLGKERLHLIKRRFGSSVSDQTKSIFNNFLDKLFTSKGNESCELSLSVENKNIPTYVSLTGHVLENGEQCHISVVDITESKQAEEMLFNSEEYLRRIISSSNDCIKVLDLEMNLLSMSTGGQKLLEIEDVTLYLNKSWVDFWKGKDKKGALEAISKAKKGDSGIFLGYSPTEKGTPKWWEIIISPINDNNGNIYRLLAVSRDITVRRQEEEELKKHQIHLEELVKDRTKELEKKNEELEKFNQLFIGREFRIKELRTEVEELSNKLSKK